MSKPAKNETASDGKRKPSRLRRFLIRFTVFVAVMAVLGGVFLAVAEHHTSQPQFCSSCHIMEPYYETWAADLHGGKLEVACVECHYAPGEQNTFKAKFRGLSQAASYFSGRYGAGRPRAHVVNASCLTSKCHGDMAFMDKPLTIGTAKFIHARHLQPQTEREEANSKRLAEIEASLKAQVGDDLYKQISEAASLATPAEQRYGELAELGREAEKPVERGLLVEFSQLKHRTARVQQLAELQCTNCHAYHANDPRTGHGAPSGHFQVATTTCFTCHFNNEGFNTGTSTCMTCHTPPQQEITVHAKMLTQDGGDASADAKPPGTELVKMNHADILSKKIACISCHADAIQEDAIVTRRDCERCHDQPRFFADWKEPFTVDLVKHYHSVHVERQKAKCQDCHSEIQHRLVRGNGEFLTSALADCARCHPNHHTAQVDLLMGRGGTTVPTSTPNLMFGSRTNCTGCHTQVGGEVHQGATKATIEACVTCHGDRHKDTFEQWKQAMEFTLGDAEEARQALQTALDQAKNIPEDVRAQIEKLKAEADADLKLVKTGNGLHNVTYAMELLDAVASKYREAAGLVPTE
jgi:nitrate/TMAO reductase-like tetraheme cytochrome c subunit